jgi:hypothetical protein
MKLFHFAKDSCSPEQNYELQRGVGLAIGKIQTHILDEVINRAYPELNDLIETSGQTGRRIPFALSPILFLLEVS